MMCRQRLTILLTLAALTLFTQGACNKSVGQLKNDASKLNKDANAAKDKAEATKADVDEKVDEGTTQASLAAAIADGSRPEKERLRDPYRHPYDTLMFFEVKPDSKVLELWPGRGWYTNVLAPYVGANGKLYVTNYSATDASEYRAKMSVEYAERLKTIPNNSQITVIDVVPSETISFGVENELDVVLTFRNIHNWMKDGSDATIYAEAFKALKPGGIFGVVEHRGNEGTTREQSIETGYVDQQQLIADIEAAGFKLVEASEINANAKDTKNYPEGVWTLPPALKLKEQDADKYLEIGESDRMTLKFMKPAE